MPRLRDPRLRPNRYKYGHDPSDEAGPSALQDCDLNEAGRSALQDCDLNEAGPSGLQDCHLNEVGPSGLHDCDLNGGENYFPLLLFLYIVKSPSN